VFRSVLISLILAAGVVFTSPAPAQQARGNDLHWHSLAPGVDYVHIPLFGGKKLADSLHVVRIDPRRAKIIALSGNDHGKRSRTARQWCNEFNLLAVINAGMYDVDATTHVGYMRTPASVNSRRWNSVYESILLLDGLSPGRPPARILDRSEVNESTLRSFGTVIQNLRLIKHPGVNVWREQQKTWSEAAIAEDAFGNILFLFLQKPLSMHEFNSRILAAGLGVVRAMHAEGGSEASLSLCADSLRLHLSGSRENGIREDGDMVQLPIPNIVGVQR